MTRIPIKVVISSLLILSFLQLGMLQNAECMGTNKNSEITIGILLPLGTFTGEQAKNGCELAIRHLNSAGSSIFKGLWEDSRSNPSAAGTRMEFLVSKKNVLGIVGPISSAPAVAVQDIANRARIVTISPLASTPALSKANDYFYRTWPSDASDAKYSSQYIKTSLKKDSAVVLYIGASYGIGLAEAFEKDFKAIGGTIRDVIQYPGDTQTFGPIAKRVIQNAPDVLYYVGYPPDMAEVLRELHTRQINFPVVSSAIVSDPTVVKLAGKYAENIMFPFPVTFDTKGTTSEMILFLKDYKELYGEEPSFIAAQAYDSFMLLAKGIHKVGTNDLPTREQIQNAMRSIKSFSGATGTFTLDQNGDAVRDFQMFHIKNGTMAPLL